MNQREAFEKYKRFKIPSLSIICEKAIQYSKTCLLTIIILLVFIYLIQEIPQWQVAQFGITNPKDLADAENSYRATLAQILGGIAIGIGLYYTWRRVTIAEKELKVSQEGQITERFTRAVDQLGAVDHFGNPALEIRLGGIYALERISTESKKDYWPIMEILTAYVRKNSSIEIVRTQKVNNLVMDIQANESTKSEASEVRRVSLDIHAILTVIKRRKNYFNSGESNILNLRDTYLEEVDLEWAHLEGADISGTNLRQAILDGAHLEGANLAWVNLEWAFLKGAHLEGADIKESHLEWAFLIGAHFEEVDLEWAHLERAYIRGAHFEGANLGKAHLEGADLEGAHLDGADLEGAHLEGAYLKGAHLERVENLTIEQLSKVTTLYNATIDEELLIQLKDKFPALFEKTDYNPYA